MFILLTCLVVQLNVQYNNFINSPRSEAIFQGLARGDYHLDEFANNPIVVWFWRSNTGSADADTLIRRIPINGNFYWSAVLRWEATELKDHGNTYEKLQLAAHLDSSAVENFLSLISLGMRTGNMKCFQTALSLPVFADFRSQIFFISNIAIVLFFALYTTAVIYVLVKTVYYLPVLSHRIVSKKHKQIYDIIKALLLLIPVFIIRNIYLIFIIYSILLTLVLTTREKNWLRSLLISVMVVFLCFLPINNFIDFLVHYTRDYQLYDSIYHDSPVIPNVQTIKEKELLAYGLKKQGQLDKALSTYEELYYRGNRTAAIVNNLANIYVLYGEKAKAESLYQRALLYGDRAEPYFNLGLLKLDDIEYSESTRYMEEARKRHFSSLNKDPIDIKPTNSEFYRTLFAQDLELEGVVKNAFMIPIVLIFVLTFFPIKLSPPFYCSSCFRPLCKECLKEVNDESLCTECFTRFKSTKNSEIEGEFRQAVQNNRRRIKRIIVYIINLIIPGAGLIYLQSHLLGLIIVFFVMLAYAPLLYAHMFVKPAGWIALSITPIVRSIAVITAIVCYIISFLLIRERNAD